MSYSQKVKECKPFVDMVKGLKDNQYMEFAYSGNRYKLKAYMGYDGEMRYSVWQSYNGMNVNKIGNTSISLYTFDMMSQKTTYTIDILKCLKEGSICVVNNATDKKAA
jgi:hypothetical protein